MTIVYWIRYPEHTNPFNEGYIGVTSDLTKRIKAHNRDAHKDLDNPKSQALLGPRSSEILVDVIFEGTSAECADEERRLRSKKNIGWNLASGGGCDRSSQQEKLYRRMMQGWISKRQYDLLIEDLNNSY